MKFYLFKSTQLTHFLKSGLLVLSIGASPMLAAAAESGVAVKTYTVKPGDTVDKVVRTQMGDSPLRADLLKDALISQNPGAFTKGNPKMLLSGAILQLPNHEALVKKHLSPLALSSEKEPVTDHVQARKHWVRYP